MDMAFTAHSFWTLMLREWIICQIVRKLSIYRFNEDKNMISGYAGEHFRKTLGVSSAPGTSVSSLIAFEPRKPDEWIIGQNVRKWPPYRSSKAKKIFVAAPKEII